MGSCVACAAAGTRQCRVVVDGAACRTSVAASRISAQLRHCTPQNHASLHIRCYAVSQRGPAGECVAQPLEWQQPGCSAATEHSEQQLWLPQQHRSLLQQLQEPAYQLQRALGVQQQPAVEYQYVTSLGGGMHARQLVVAAAAAGVKAQEGRRARCSRQQ